MARARQIWSVFRPMQHGAEDVHNIGDRAFFSKMMTVRRLVRGFPGSRSAACRSGRDSWCEGASLF